MRVETAHHGKKTYSLWLCWTRWKDHTTNLICLLNDTQYSRTSGLYDRPTQPSHHNRVTKIRWLNVSAISITLSGTTETDHGYCSCALPAMTVPYDESAANRNTRWLSWSSPAPAPRPPATTSGCWPG